MPRAGDLEVTVRVKPADTLEALAAVTSAAWRGSAAYYPAEGRISLRCTVYPDTLDQLAAIRAFADSRGGAAIVERMPRTWAGVDPFGPPRPASVRP
jgi:hypothetical protein